MRLLLDFYPSHKKGEETRTRIFNLLTQNPNLSSADVSSSLGLSIDQVERHRKTLVREGKLQPKKAC